MSTEEQEIQKELFEMNLRETCIKQVLIYGLANRESMIDIISKSNEIFNYIKTGK